MIPSMRVPEPTPDEGETVSHGGPEKADHGSEPPPAVVIVTNCADGGLPPSMYEKLALLGEREMEGCWVARPAMMFIASVPANVVMLIVAIPAPKVAGRIALIRLSVHEST